jgi:hypothetical protein
MPLSSNTIGEDIFPLKDIRIATPFADCGRALLMYHCPTEHSSVRIPDLLFGDCETAEYKQRGGITIFDDTSPPLTATALCWE